jgi:FkbM family methyltransferase
MNELSLRMRDGTQIVVPAALEAITTYVILEQEKWFEKEMTFLQRWLRPGMNAIDIGANLGVYSLPMARMVGPDGHVLSYEPASETRRLLRISKKLNRAANLHIIAAALSDGEREGRLVLGVSSELNSLHGSGPGEDVKITSLDSEDRARDWGRVDFLKIDAEGEEERILAGARSFLAHRSPLVMFEVKAGEQQNRNLPSAFTANGFAIYRLLAGAPVLVPVAAEEPLDSYELNLFAARADRASDLASQGLLVDTIPEWHPDDDARSRAGAFIKSQPFGPIFASLSGDGVPEDATYRDALTAYAMWRSTELPLRERCAALRFACDTLTSQYESEPSLARLSTLARVTSEMGRRTVSVQALRKLADILKLGTGHILEPFWPANPRFDSLVPGPNVVEWFVAAALEQFELTATYSSMFGSCGVDLSWLSGQPFVSAEIGRRRILALARAGRKVEVPPRLLAAAPDNLNADSWRAGLVPNTFVRR